MIVTHSLDMVTRFCDEALWLDAGRARVQGEPQRVIDAYLTEVARGEQTAQAAGQPPRPVTSRSVGVQLLGADGAARPTTIRLLRAAPVSDPTRRCARVRIAEIAFGVGIFNADGVRCYGTNTQIEGLVPRELVGEGTVTCVIDRLDLVAGTYTLDSRSTADGTRLCPRPSLHVHGHIAGQGRRRLPAAAPVDVRRRHASRSAVHAGQIVRPSSRAHASRLRRGRGVRGDGPERAAASWCSRTASSICCIPGTSGICEDARALGDALVVGSQLRSLGPAPTRADRPIVPEHERAEVLLALGCVDAVVIFDEDTPHAIVSRVQPDVLVKGADWGADNIVGRDVVEARGGRVVRVELAPGFSTTDLIDGTRARGTTRRR